MANRAHPGIPSRGFTLIELLIVVAIIAILAAIAVPNLLTAQTRAKVARVQADQRSISVALESYAVDWNTYPTDAVGNDYKGLVSLTTPVAFITKLPQDPFNKGYIDGYAAVGSGPIVEATLAKYYELGTGSTFGPGINFPANVWAMAAYGPDLDDDTDTIGSYPYTSRAVPYDPTNGTVSNGDIYRLGPKDSHPNYVADVNPEVY